MSDKKGAFTVAFLLWLLSRRAGASSGVLTVKPVAGGHKTSGFGWRHHPVLKERKHHNGIDISAPPNSPIVAAGAGTVTKAGDNGNGYGNEVRIDHGDGLETRYGHMRDKPLVQVGERVRAGEQLGIIGSTGMSTGIHLHFETRVNKEPKDPEKIFPGVL